MGAPRTWRWADGLLATGEEARSMLRLGHDIGRRSLVVGEAGSGAFDAIVDALGEGPVDAVTASDAHRLPLADARHIVLDVSGGDPAPTLDVVRWVLDRHAGGGFDGELQVVATETDRARPLRPDAAAPCLADPPAQEEPVHDELSWCLWLPLLSEGRAPALARLQRQLAPDEVCPVLPFPARDPRRADDLLLEHRALLVDRLPVGSGIVYAHERDPFDLYRTLAALAGRHPPARLVVSPTEPGLPALGALLASYEFGFPLLWPVADDRPFVAPGRPCGHHALTCVWLTGEPYGPTVAGRTS